MPFNEQVKLYDYEIEFIDQIRPVLEDLGVARLWKKAHRRGREAAQPHLWQVGGKSNDSDWRKKTHVEFDGFFYNEDDPDRGATVVQKLGSPRIIYSRVFRPDVDYDVEINEQEDTSIETWHEDEFGTSFNVTNRTTVKADASAEVAGIGGSASVESETTTSLDTSFAMNNGKRNTRDSSLSIVGRATVPAGREMLATAEAQKQQHITTYEVNGYIDHATKLDLYDWVEENAPYLRDGKDKKHNVIYLPNLTAMRNFIQGFWVAEYPNTRNFLKESRAAQRFLAWLNDAEQRHVQFERQKIVVAEQATEVAFKFIDGG